MEISRNFDHRAQSLSDYAESKIKIRFVFTKMVLVLNDQNRNLSEGVERSSRFTVRSSSSMIEKVN